MKKPKLAVWKFASCDGCQLSLIDCEDEILQVADLVEIANFKEITRSFQKGPYDLSLVEGSITTPEDLKRIQEVRRISKKLITIGACATAGGIQALRNFQSIDEFVSIVYAKPEYIQTLSQSTAIADHVAVDFELRGCPIDKYQLLEVINAFLNHRKPITPAHSVCLECRLAGQVCVMVAHGTPCLGPVTHAGCGALCPKFYRGCYGCFGPMETPNTPSLSQAWLKMGRDRPEVFRAFQNFNAGTEAFREAGEDLKKMAPKTIKVDYLARVEGEGSLTLRFDGKKAKSVELLIFEPPRFFEAFLRGRSQLEVPDITARICGICPVAYQMSSCQAVENGLNVKVPDELGDLRRVLYCGEWLESHLLHIFMLHAPDFLGFEDAMQMARANPDYAQWVRLGLRLKKAGNKIVSFLGGREIHPINVRVGGFYRIPPKKESFPLIEELKECRKLSEKALHWLAGFTFPEFERDYEFVALHHADEYAITRGEIISNRGVNIKIKDYDRVFEERQVAHSNALHSQIIDRGSYFCGPLARVNLNFDQLPQNIKDLAKAIGFQVPCQNPFKSILARGLEVCLAFQEAVRILENLAWPQEAYTEIPVKKAIGYGATEAPRGLLYHRYHLNKDGLIEDAKIVPPTSQNQSIIEEDLFEMAPQLAELKHSEATWRAEQAIRNYDPCISCATHFLKLKIEND